MKKLAICLIVFLLNACSTSLTEKATDSNAPEFGAEYETYNNSESDNLMEVPRTAEPPPPPPIIREEQSPTERKDKESKKAKSTTWKRSNKQLNTATLFIGDEEKLALEGTQIAINVDGFRARVLIDCFFYNDHTSQKEGTFKMRLPQGASPYYLAFGQSVYLNQNDKTIPFINAQQIDFSHEGIEKMRSDSWSSPKEAKIVEKEKAAFAYHSEVRKKVDPALAEWAGADVFNCRVFPLLPKQLHRIVIGYDVNLTNIDKDWLLNFEIPKGDFSSIIDVEVANINGINSSITPSNNIESKANAKKARFIDAKEDAITIRYENLGDHLIKDDANQYFAASINPNLPISNEQNIASDATIALDISLSSNPNKFNVWVALTKALLENNRDVIKRFNVLLFNVEAFWWKENSIPNTKENVDQFLRFANTLSLEGASDLSLVMQQIKEKNQSKNIFLLSDGAITWGNADPYYLSNQLNPNQALYAYNTGMSGTSMQTLAHLTRESGGAIFSVVNEDQLTKASTAFRNKAWKIESIDCPNTTDLLIAGRPQYLYNGQQLMIAGRMNQQIRKNTSINLLLTQNGLKKTITIPITNALQSGLAKRAYGQIATNQLEEFGDATQDFSISYAKYFKVPGKTCSMLMLETERDYLNYNIKATDDQFVVKSSNVKDIIKKTLKQIGSLLANAKTKFTNWLDKLEKMPGLAFEKSQALNIVVDQLTEKQFQIEPKGLQCASRVKNDLTTDFQKLLLNDRLPYSEIVANATLRNDKYGSGDALKALSSLIEKNPGDGVLTRDVAFSALAWNLNEQAYFLLKRMLDSRPYEPQTYLAIAKALDKMDKKELALIYYEIAISTKWNPRFGEFNKIASLDYLHFLKSYSATENSTLSNFITEKIKTIHNSIPEKEAALLVTISWNTDNTDIDLHIKEPNGEVCFYQNNKTKIGGQLTQDVTQGYGPEMYILEKATKGKFKIKAKYYAQDTNRSSTRTKVYATIYKNLGKANEEVIQKVVTLSTGEEMHDIYEIEI